MDLIKVVGDLLDELVQLGSSPVGERKTHIVLIQNIIKIMYVSFCLLPENSSHRRGNEPVAVTHWQVGSKGCGDHFCRFYLLDSGATPSSVKSNPIIIFLQSIGKHFPFVDLDASFMSSRERISALI